MVIGIKEILCKHSVYTIIKSERADTKYVCQCQKCGHQWTKMKAAGEDYEVGTIVHR